MSSEEGHLIFIFDMDIFYFWSVYPFLSSLKQKYNICLIGHKQAVIDGLKFKFTHV